MANCHDTDAEAIEDITRRAISAALGQMDIESIRQLVLEIEAGIAQETSPNNSD